MAAKEWDEACGGVGEPPAVVRVMTEEQVEVLRRQIGAYAVICEQLVEMHRAIAAQQDSLAGMRMGNLYCDPLISPVGHKIAARHRWTPTPMQLRILESIFDRGNGTPSKQKIKEITLELSQHGQISETNVYNWFQNRRARSKRKKATVASGSGSASAANAQPNSAESEAEGDDEAPNESEKRPRLDFNEHSRSSSSSGHAPPFFDNILLGQRVDRFLGRAESSRSYCHLREAGESFDMLR